MRKRVITSLLMVPLAVAGCSTPESDDDTAPDETTAAAGSEGETSPVEDGLDLLTDEPDLAIGDCWGLEDEIMLDPVPCDGPHIYEVVGIVEDWEFELSIEADQAMMDACDAEAAAYFGYDPVDEGIMVAPGEPKFAGQDLLYCSAHSGPDVEFVGDEVTGSFADRGWR